MIHRDTIQVKSTIAVDYRSFECQLLRLTSSNSKSSDVINLVVVYRPPSTDLSEFYDDLSILFDKFGDVIDRDQFICCGDFNCGGDSPTTTSPDLQSVLEAHGLQQLVKSPTRRTSKKSSLLDLVVCVDLVVYVRYQVPVLHVTGCMYCYVL